MKLEAEDHRSLDADTLNAIIDFLSHLDELRESEVPLGILDVEMPDGMFRFATHLKMNFGIELWHASFPLFASSVQHCSALSTFDTISTRIHSAYMENLLELQNLPGWSSASYSLELHSSGKFPRKPT